MSGEPILCCSGLGKRYGRRTWALRDCDLELPRGGIVGLVGANGAGKSTLLHLAIGLLRPTEGSVRMFGEPLRVDQADGLARIGFVAQDHPLYRRFTVADLLHFGRSTNRRFDLAGARDRLDGIGITLERRASTLSGGQQAQIALTLALAKRPRLLVLDEPVASLDPLARRDFLRTLVDAVAGSVAGDDLTVVLSSHVVAELERVCDHLVLLDEGRVRLAGAIDDLLAEHRVLVGPRADDLDTMDGVIAASHGQRHSNMLVRLPGPTSPHPRWESHPVGLEELVLAYLGEGRNRPCSG